MDEDKIKKEGIRVDDYLVCFPEGDFVEETDDGGLSILVDVYKVMPDSSLASVPKEQIDEQLEKKISATIEYFITRAIEEQLGTDNVEDQAS